MSNDGSENGDGCIDRDRPNYPTMKTTNPERPPDETRGKSARYLNTKLHLSRGRNAFSVDDSLPPTTDSLTHHLPELQSVDTSDLVHLLGIGLHRLHMTVFQHDRVIQFMLQPFAIRVRVVEKSTHHRQVIQ